MVFRLFMEQIDELQGTSLEAMIRLQYQRDNCNLCNNKIDRQKEGLDEGYQELVATNDEM